MKELAVFILMANFALAAASAPFQNLNFDEGITDHVDALGFGPTSELLPGWQVGNPNGVYSSIWYNSAPLGNNWVGLIPKDSLRIPVPAFGLYSVAIDPGISGSLLNPITLSERGDVPADAKTINFINYGAPLELRLNGTLIPLTYADGGTVYSVTFARDVSGDVSAFAGQNVEMAFSAFFEETLPRAFIHGLDSISFQVPEPSTWLLLGLGGLTIFFVRQIRSCG